MPVYEIPLIPQSQAFNIALAGVTYKLVVLWSAQNSVWLLNIADKNGLEILSGIPLVTGCDLLDPYGYLNFGGTLIASTDGDQDLVPAYSNLGSTAHLYFTTPS